MQDSSKLKLQIPSLAPLAPSHSPPFYYIPPYLSKIHPRYLNSETHSHSTPYSLFNIITLLLPALNFSPLLLHTWTNRPTIILRSSFYSPHRTKSSGYKRPGYLRSLASYRSLNLLLPILIFTSFITPSIYTLKSQRNMTHPCLTSLSIQYSGTTPLLKTILHSLRSNPLPCHLHLL